MKKLILLLFIMTGMLSFSRYVERCRITGPLSCKSLDSGKVFNFDKEKSEWFNINQEGYIFKVTFYGDGYDDLILTDFEYVGR